jgi:D-arabinan exo alpha-(1,3)/(1,5)-arabinofuranosidase (non-reducing end)
MTRSTAASLFAILVGTVPCPAADPIPLTRLLRELTDLRALAEFPDPPFATKQFSSYDRSGGNQDRGHPFCDGVLTADTPFYKSGPMQGQPADGTLAKGTRVGLPRHRQEIGQYVWVYASEPIDGAIRQGYVDKSAIRMNKDGPVLAEMDGPGSIVRIWSANPADAGTVRIYLDHAAEPVIAARMQDLLGGTWEMKVNERTLTPFPSPLAGERGRGWNLYFPIPYQRHCKIVAEKGDLAYQVTYRTYAREMNIETFSFKNLAALGERSPDARWRQLMPASAAAKQNSDADAVATPEARGEAVLKLTRLEPGKSLPLPIVVRESEARAIVDLRLRIAAPRLPEALRSVVLVGQFDEPQKPQIEVPLGDLFGTSPGANAYSSLPLSVLADGTLHSRWCMPFAKSATLELRNHGSQTVAVEGSTLTVPYRWTESSMHFHARWRQEVLTPLPLRDESLCKLEGKGVYVGTMLSVMNPVSSWWGEGDSRIYIDGERVPGIHGTGTDDDFGLAWRSGSTFQHAFHNQTRCDGPGNFGHTSMNRFHIVDRIPFTKSFRHDLEIAPWDPNARLGLALTCYWYAVPGATDAFPPLDTKKLEDIPAPPPIYRIAGALEGEKLRIVRKSGAFPVDAQDMLAFPDGKWSAGGQLWARPTKKGEWVDLELSVPADGRYQVIVHLTKGPEYGEVMFTMDGKAAGASIDLFLEKIVSNAEPVDLGVFELKRGQAVLRIETVGTNEKSVGRRFAWGLDCVVLKPVK